jgi:soluble lytic murein transglycosylase
VVGIDLGDARTLTAAAPRRRVPLALAAAAVLLALGTGAWMGRRERPRAPDLSAHATVIEAAAAEFALDPHLLRGLMAAESGGRVGAVSRTGAVGLLQLMPATAREEAARRAWADYRDEDLADPRWNVRIGAAYLRRLLDRFGGSEPFAVAAYNAGPTPVLRWRRRAPDADPAEVVRREGYAETRRHVERVLRLREVYAGT